MIVSLVDLLDDYLDSCEITSTAEQSFDNCLLRLKTDRLQQYFCSNLKNSIARIVNGNTKILNRKNKNKIQPFKTPSLYQMIKDASQNDQVMHGFRIDAQNLAWYVEVMISADQNTPHDPPFSLLYMEFHRLEH